jgi:hypothetical protein
MNDLSQFWMGQSQDDTFDAMFRQFKSLRKSAGTDEHLPVVHFAGKRCDPAKDAARPSV